MLVSLDAFKESVVPNYVTPFLFTFLLAFECCQSPTVWFSQGGANHSVHSLLVYKPGIPVKTIYLGDIIEVVADHGK